jgi:hypothetical protein
MAMLFFRTLILLLCLSVATDAPAQRKKNDERAAPHIQNLNGFWAEKEGPAEVDFPSRFMDSRLLFELAQTNKDVRALLQEKRDAAKAAFDANFQLVAQGKKSLDLDLLAWSKRFLDADLEIAESPQERVAALELHWLLARKLEIETAVNVASGRLHTELLFQTRYFRIEVELAYAKEKGKTVKTE